MTNELQRRYDLEEVRLSSFIAWVDVVLFFASGMFAMGFFLRTHNRMTDLKRQQMDVDPLVCRRSMLGLLGCTNMLRAVCLIIEVQFHREKDFIDISHMHIGRHARHRLKHHYKAWMEQWFDYLISSFPTLVWVSMLSVLLLFMMEVHYRLKMKDSQLLRPMCLFVNAVAYLLYVAVAVLTLDTGDISYKRRDGGYVGENAYTFFWHFAYSLIACAHVVLATGLLYFGLTLSRQLADRSALTLLYVSDATEKLVLRVRRLAIVLSIVEFVRMVNDYSYFNDATPWDFHDGLKSMSNVAIEKVFLEWLPSVFLLYTFWPTRRGEDTQNTSSGQFVDPLLPPGPPIFERTFS